MREIKADFDILKAFVQNYSLSSHLIDTNYLTTLSKQHKKLFSYLTLIAELQNVLRVNGSSSIIQTKQLSFLEESCSDMANSYFVSFHGAYKVAKLSSRSSIENFMKGFSLNEITDIDSEKSVYNIFDRVKALPFFQNEPQLSIFNDIHQKYKELCLDAHTATITNMERITAINHFPTFDNVKAKNHCNKFNKLIDSYTRANASKLV